MKLKIRYENQYQTIDLDLEAMNGMWVSLGIDEDQAGLTEEEQAKRIQDAFDDQYNKPEYNAWHKWDRHIDPNPKARRMDGRRGYIQADPDDDDFDVLDYLAVTHEDHSHLDYEEVCTWIRNALVKKPEWADAFIAVRIDKMPIRDYAAQKGEPENSITQKLKRAAEKLKKFYQKP